MERVSLSVLSRKRKHCISMPCEIAIYRMVGKFQATDLWLDKIKYDII